jgi:signal transduction histidine kinase
VIHYTPENVPPEIPRDVVLCLYRIFQESLRNIAKHAQAPEASVSLLGNGDSIDLCIQDSGLGFDLAQGKKSVGLGLASMEERVHLIQGEFSIRSQPGQGTLIQVRAPISEISAQAVMKTTETQSPQRRD